MNENIISELKEEHKEIISFFNRVDIANSLEEKKKLVQDLKLLLGEHMHKEDTLIYPVLLKSDDEEVRALGNGFLDSMVNYSEIFIGVVEGVMTSSEPIGLTVVKDYENIRDRIKDRIFVEEVALFPAYERERNEK
jgi:iron-sulfur cluster repair protein YtfE (RIC family)